MNYWLQKAALRQQHAWAPGTLNNYRSSLKKYLEFCYAMGVDAASPLYQDICAYIEYLVHSTPSPRTLSNHISHLRTYMRKSQLSTEQADHCRVKWALYALSRDHSYVPRIKSAFPTDVLQEMLRDLPHDAIGNILKVSILIMFYAALRQSEVLAYSSNSFNPRTHLTRSDIVVRDQSIVVCVKFAKNMQSVYESKSITLQAAPDQELCVVHAYRRMLRYTPTVNPQDPAIMFPASRRPVSVDYVRKNWQRHITERGVDTSTLSLHSIRKSAATAAHAQGCDELKIQKYGGWKSNAHRVYVTTNQSEVNSAIIRELNK